jgi:hypothetical protein
VVVSIGSLVLGLVLLACTPSRQDSKGGAGGSGGSGSGGATASGGAASGGSSGAGGKGESGGSSGSSGSGGNESGGSSGSSGNESGGNSGSSGSGGSSSQGGTEAGGSSGSGGSGETGGSGGSGGSGGVGGSSSTTCPTSGSDPTLDCKNAIVPANGSNGGVTDFSDYATCSGKWGTKSNLYGPIYGYAGKSSSLKSEVTSGGLHMTGSVVADDYGGGGISFNVCATVASFTKIQFTISGSAPGCDLELQIKTYDQVPTDQGGGCSASSCYSFPVAKQVAVLSSSSTEISKTLATDFSPWNSTNAGQVVGLQWQFTGTNLDGDAGTSCPIDVTITKIKFM